MKVMFTSILVFFLFTQSFGQSWKELNDSVVYYSDKKEYNKGITVGEKAIKTAKEQYGINDSNYAASLDNQASLYFNQGQYEKAEPLFVESSEIRKKIFGPNHVSFVTSLNNLAILYEGMNQYEKAEPLYIQAKNIRKKTLGESHPDYASSLNSLATLYTAMGQYEKAEPLYIQAKDIRKKTLGESHPDYASSLNNLAGLYYYMGQYEKAEPLFIQDIEITKKGSGETHPDYATSLSNLATLYNAMGKYEKSEPLCIQSKDIRKMALGESHPDYAFSLNSLATLYYRLGQYEKAVSLFIETKDILRKSLGETDPVYASSLNNLATVYTDMGQYAKSESLYFQAIEIYRKTVGESHSDYAVSLNNLAQLYKDIGQYEKAEPLYIQAGKIDIKALGEVHPSYATDLSNLAALYNDMKQFEKAEPLYIAAMGIFKKALGETHPNYASSINNLATLYTDMGQYEKATPLYIQVNDMRKTALGNTHPAYGTSIYNLATLYRNIGQYEKAEPLYIQANEIRKMVLGESHPYYAETLNGFAELYQRMGLHEKAEPLMLQTSRIELQNLLNTFNILSEKEKGNYIQNKISLIQTNNNFIYNYKKASPAIVQNSFNLQLAFKSFILADTRNILASLQQSNDMAMQRLLNDWITAKTLLAKQYALPLASRRADLKDIETKAENLEKELGLRSSALRDRQHSVQLKIGEVQKGLQQNEAAIEFVSFNLHNKKWTDSIIYAAYIINKNDSVPYFIPLFEEKQLQQLLDESKKINRTPVKVFYGDGVIAAKNKSTKQGEALSRLIWQPLEAYLTGIKKISYSPAGKLFNIAFHALPAGNDSLLMEKYQLQQYTSTRQVALRSPGNQTIKPASITLFGDAVFSMDSAQLTKQRKDFSQSYASSFMYAPSLRGGDFEPWRSLPGTAEEVNSIKQLFDKNKIVTSTFAQTTASEENLKALSGNSPQILHIATHGFFLPEPNKTKNDKALNQTNAYTLADDPLLRTGLILAGGNYAWSGKVPVEGVEDGIATAYEISQLNLSNTELVVLSACETALGDVKGSEGVFGLQRAFKMAGVKKMLVSLWKIPDKETAELMISFYTYWMKGKTINEAFAQAQADMRKKYSPFYWAAFVLVE